MTKTLKKTLPIILSLLGVALFTFIAAKAGIHPVMEALGKVGVGGFFLLVLVQIVIDIGLGIAWKSSVPQIGFLRLTAARLVRDAAGACLPFSQLGGMVLGVRATLAGRSAQAVDGEDLHWPEGVAANLVDITTEVLGQIAFILVAILCLVGHQGAARFIWPLMGGMVLLSLGIAGFIWTQHRGGSMVRKAAMFFGRHIAADWRESLIGNTEIFQVRLESLWSRPDRIMMGALSHFVCWVGGAAATWIALTLLGAHVGFLSALAIEGVVCGIMSAGFLVPAALGVQEAAYVALGLIFGIDSQISLSLSLLRRGRDILIGIPVLLGWQLVEMSRLRKQSAPVPPREKTVTSVLKKTKTSVMSGSVKKDVSANRDTEDKDDAAFATAPRVL
ncbi:lysylphosphatidylglycerol synthase domain-containing protein [Gluconobacter frateurii]|uniref:lysylphosphatidylglycerol synthase domain-containing protein n=1 Tax=Gluconobacter frateurii TaxID=38308 RepID=UPI001F05AAE4|nr:lysylphosphatidylglycerol synthase domain-containing protein [Gluconobacter frateurii]UMM08325.1 lysylphosphatidylglycerol synthase domain-containing protein [Gluconobacter frateurii]